MSDLIVRVRADTASVESALKGVEARLAQVGSEAKQSLPPVTDGVQKAAAAAREAAQQTGNWGSRLGTLLAGGAVATGLQALIDRVQTASKALLDAQIRAERLAIGLQFAVGANAGRDMEFLREVTNRLGLQFGSTAEAYQRFAAAARETRLEGAGARSVFESVAKASAVMGLSAEQTSGVLLALQQMISKGTVQSEELRGQLGERLPGAFQIAARAMGVTTAELGKMLEQGQVIADDFLPKFAAQLNAELGGAAEQAANRTEAAVNRLQSSWDRLQQATAQSGAGGFIAGQLNVLRDGLDSVSERMTRAREAGGGFASQMAAAAGAVLQFLNPLNAFVYSAQSSAERLKAAQTEVKELEAALDKRPNNLMLKAALRDTQALVAELQRAQVAGSKALSGFGIQGSADNQAARVQAQERARIEREALAVMQQASGVNAQFLGNLNKLNAAYEIGELSIERYRAEVEQLILKQAGGAEVVSKWRQEQEKAAKAFDDALLDSWKIVWADLDKQAEAARKSLEEQTKARAAYGAELAKGITALDDEIRKRRDALVEMGLTTEGLHQLRQAQLDVAIAAEERKLDAVELDDAERKAIELRIARLKELRTLEGAGAEMAAGFERERRAALNETATRAEDGWRAAFAEYERLAKDAAGEAARHFGTFARGAEDAFVTAARGGRASFSEMLDQMAEDLLRSAFRRMLVELANSQGFQDWGWSIWQAFGGAMAGGGRPQPGRPYLVGERGMEIFVPDQSGTVVPNHQLGMGGGEAMPRINLNVINNAGAEVRPQAQRMESDGSLTLDVILEAAESRLAGNVVTGRGALAGAMQNTFGLRRRV
jgi:tape measure domain-containing protein